jgi:demethylmenaquinone methyltransferase/2-methoxy-6-polyprenyl-1,4-benzoquinol methylase
MANPYYDPGGARATQVNRLFARIARRYDLLNDLQSFGLHRAWKARLVALANLKPGEPALDVCCGTGDIALALAGRGAVVTGLDFTIEMLDVARQRGAGRSGVAFIQGDALALPFEKDSFAAVTVGYGLRNLADWQGGLREMLRVARPGGRLLVLDFGKPDNAAWRGIYFAYLRLAVPLFGLLGCGDAQAYAYILESLRHYPAQRGVEAWMREAGLANVRTLNLLGGVMSINVGEKATAG